MTSDMSGTAACRTALVVHQSHRGIYSRGQIRAGACILKVAATSKSYREVSTRPRPLHVSAFKAIVHHLTEVESYERSVPMELSFFVALQVAFLPLVGLSPTSSSPPCKAPPSYHTGVFPSSGFFGEMRSIMLCSCQLLGISASIYLGGKGKQKALTIQKEIVPVLSYNLDSRAAAQHRQYSG
jgi:hypothetical protein